MASKDMLWLKMFIFCNFLTLFKVVVAAESREKDKWHGISAESMSSLPFPIALQLIHSLGPLDYDIFKDTMIKSNTIFKEHKNYKRLSNDAEVFKDKLGPQMEKQEEEPEPEEEGEEAQPEAEETEDEAAENEAEPAAEAEPEPEAEPEAEPESEAEPAPEPEAESGEPKVEEEIPAEPAADDVTAKEPEPEPAVADETSNTAEVAADNEESEMPNDEPAKDEDAEKGAEDATKTIITKTTDKPEVSCFACTSIEDLKCHLKPTKEMTCPKVNEGDEGKHNGCYTLYQVDTNITMRGCVDELAEEGLKYCLKNEELCSLCYENGCNNKIAPNKATIQQLNFYTMIFLNIFSIIIIEKLEIFH